MYSSSHSVALKIMTLVQAQVTDTKPHECDTMEVMPGWV